MLPSQKPSNGSQRGKDTDSPPSFSCPLSPMPYPRSFTLFALLLFGATSVWAQPAGYQPADSLVVMNLAAHPDDEDGSTLAYYRRAKNAAAYSVIFTRGEGGQNEIGPELYEELGAIRTDETERAARHLGTQVYFLNFDDFGYSKEASEAFARWGGRDEVTGRLVYLIRKLKPDVLFTNHDTVTVGPGRQHGQHQAVGVSAYDAFALAADADYRPEQLAEEGVDLWQPKRLFLRRWRGDEGMGKVAVPVGDTDPRQDKRYTEMAADALGEHASQGMDQFANYLRGRDATRFTLLRSATDVPLEATDLTAGLPPNTTAQPSLDYLIDAGRAPSLPQGTLRLDDSTAVPGQTIRLTWTSDALPAQNVRWHFEGPLGTTSVHAEEKAATLTIARDAVSTIPKARYQYERFTNEPPVTYALYHAATDSLMAAGYLPLEIAPPLALEGGEPVVRLKPGPNRIPVEVQVFDPKAERLMLRAVVSGGAENAPLAEVAQELPFRPGEPVTEALRVNLPETLAEGDYTVALVATAEPVLGAPSASDTAQVDAYVFEVDVPKRLRVGVIESYDNTLDRALSELGVTHQLLDSLDLAEGRFDSLHTILVDIRAYLVRPDLRAHNDKLLQWVEKGGHLIVNYQKTFEWEARFAPYQLELGRDRVTREDAVIELLLPQHAFFTTPNAVDQEDWQGWVQERGLYFPASYDPYYQELFSMHDPGEAPLRSSTLFADYGEGTYLYTALAWYRQLRVFHPGAYALFANMISLPLEDGRAVPLSSD